MAYVMGFLFWLISVIYGIVKILYSSDDFKSSDEYLERNGFIVLLHLNSKKIPLYSLNYVQNKAQ